MERRSIAYPGGRLSFLHGEGDPSRAPVVFNHGLAGSGEGWLSVADRLDSRRWYALDAPGHGHSDWQEKYSFQLDASALLVFLSDVSGPAVVVGHSRGGLTASLAAMMEPSLFRGLYLEDVTPLFWREAAGRNVPFLRSVFALRGIAMQAAAEGLGVDWIGGEIGALAHDASSTFGEVLTPAAIEGWAKAVTEFDPEVLGARAEFLPPEASAESILSTVGCPVHLAHGDVETGSAVTPEEKQWFDATARQPSTTRFPGLGHFLHAANPATFAEALEAFLRVCP